MASVLNQQTIGVVALFVTNGLMIGAWAAQVPVFAERLQLSESGLGLIMLGFSIGAIAMMAATPRLSRSYGAERIAIIAGVLFTSLIVVPIAAPSMLLAAFGAIFLGAANGSMDVMMNAVAVEHERECGSTILSRLHGTWSIGAVLGALLGGLLAQWQFSPVTYCLWVSLAGLVVVAPSLLLWNVRLVHQRAATEESASHGFAGLSQFLVVLALIACACFMAEGAMLDWLTKLMREFGANEFLGASIYAAFSTGMAVGRFSGDSLSRWVGDDRLVTGGATLAAIGLTLTLATGTISVSLPAMLVMGLGVANIVPVTFRHAGQHGNDPTASLAVVTVSGYSGLLLGPPIIGFVADASSLPTALFLVVAGLISAALLSGLFFRARVGTPTVEPSA